MVRSRWALLVVLASFVCLSAIGCGRPGGILLTPVSVNKQLEETVIHRDSGWAVTDKIAVIDVEGIIANAETGAMFGPHENPVALFIEKLDKAAGDSDVKAVVLRINSPGGTVAASDIMHRELKRFRERRPDVKVVADILDVGASGAYYLACGAEKIYALPSSVTASIGVILQTFSLTGSMGMLGIKTEAIKSGEMKDMGSPLKDRTEREKMLLQQMINEYYEGFLTAVLDGRAPTGMNREKLMPVADGRVLTGKQAKEAGLVDELLYPDRVIDQVKKDADISRARVVMYHRPMGYRSNYYSRTGVDAPSTGTTVNLLNINASGLQLNQPQFLYMWTGQ